MIWLILLPIVFFLCPGIGIFVALVLVMGSLGPKITPRQFGDLFFATVVITAISGLVYVAWLGLNSPIRP
jgi:hypothetical protein